MKYTVTYTPFADFQLCDIWLRATNRQQVTNTPHQIELTLSQDAEHVGQLRRDGRRTVAKPPLGYTFEVSPDDCLVTVVSVRFLPPPQQTP